MAAKSQGSSGLQLTLYIATWVPLHQHIVDQVTAHAQTAGVPVKVVDIDVQHAAAETARVITVPTAILTGPGLERRIFGRDTVDELPQVLSRAVSRARR